MLEAIALVAVLVGLGGTVNAVTNEDPSVAKPECEDVSYLAKPVVLSDIMKEKK